MKCNEMMRNNKRNGKRLIASSREHEKIVKGKLNINNNIFFIGELNELIWNS
jgi:hypothetical protein